MFKLPKIINTVLSAILLLYSTGMAQSQTSEISYRLSLLNTSLPNYVSSLAIANDGLIIPGLITLQNANTVITLNAPTMAQSKWGVSTGFEYSKPLKRGWSLASELGVSYTRFDIDLYVDHPETDKVYLRELTSDFGNIGMILLNVLPFRLSKKIAKNRISIHVAPAMNFLLTERYNDLIIVYDESSGSGGNEPIVSKLYVHRNPKRAKLLFGMNYGVEVNLYKGIKVHLSYEHSISRLYEAILLNELVFQPSRPKYITIGLKRCLMCSKVN